MRRRLLLTLLLCLALAGGLWWNASRLNETEQKLVGVWERAATDEGIRAALFLMADGRMFVAGHGAGEWSGLSNLEHRWHASEGKWTYSEPRRLPNATSGLLDRLLAYFSRHFGRMSVTSDVVHLDSREFSYRTFSGPTHQMTRSEDPELKRIFDRLSAGESP